MQKILNFTKIEHTIFSLPLILAGAWLGAGNRLPPLRTLVLLVLAGVGARVLGMSMNRILDRAIDAKNPRTRHRELPTGVISLRVALGIAGLGFLVYELACFLLGPLVFALSPLPAAALIGYSFLKRFTPLCHFGIGLVMGLAPVGAYVATRGAIAPDSDILLLTAFAFFWMSGFDIIYALMDLSFDRKNQVRSLPASLGSTGAQVIAAFAHTAALSALVGLALAKQSGSLTYIALATAAVAFICAYLPAIPLSTRFFPISAVAGIAGAAVSFL